MQKYTKIVATISDKRCEPDFIRQLYKEGMNVVRMNSAHLQREGFLKIINNVRSVSRKIALLVDTKGPEVRTTVAEDDRIVLRNDQTGEETEAPIIYRDDERLQFDKPESEGSYSVILQRAGEVKVDLDKTLTIY